MLADLQRAGVEDISDVSVRLMGCEERCSNYDSRFTRIKLVRVEVEAKSSSMSTDWLGERSTILMGRLGTADNLHLAEVQLLFRNPSGWAGTQIHFGIGKVLAQTRDESMLWNALLEYSNGDVPPEAPSLSDSSGAGWCQ